MIEKLAIVIPAYKDTFLKASLDSIASQTCKNFTLYIGDDCSPYDLKMIVDEYKGAMNVVYKRFEKNLGGKDLVAQWERCIDLTRGEPYIWLFSDDDVLDKNCVEEFYKTLDERPDSDLFHFDVKVIDDDGIITRTPKAYPEGLDNLTYYKGKIKGEFMSLVVENIFSRSIYEKCEGFQNFDLAWGSDTVTWIKFSAENGFVNIPNAYVYWRSGLQNISPDLSSPVAERKIRAVTEGFNWVYKYFKKDGKKCWVANFRGFISRAILFGPYVKRQTLIDCVKSFCKVHRCCCLYFPMMLVIRAKIK